MDINQQHSNTTEKVGMGLVCSVETFKKGNIQLVKRLSGFNGLSIYKNGEVRKIELKTMERSDNWIAINGHMAIDKLFFERDYWMYFVLIPENIVVMTRALPFIYNQMRLSNETNFLKELEAWIKSTKNLSKISSLKFIPRINIKFNYSLRKLSEYIVSETYKHEWDNSVIEIWQNQSEWKCLYKIEEF